MIKTAAIVGAGINGLLIAYLISQQHPDVEIRIYDTDGHPANPASDNTGATHGSKDARHITGSESIGYENSINRRALRESPNTKGSGWLLKEEADLTDREQNWRKEFEASYSGLAGLNEIDFAHAKLNYEGILAWHELVKHHGFLARHMITSGFVEVYFQSREALEEDYLMESEFCDKYFQSGLVHRADNNMFDNLYNKKLVVPGMSIRIKSLAFELIKKLEANKKVVFHWSTTVRNASEADGEVVVWTSGVTHEQPEEQLEYNVQGIIGCWATVENPGYKQPFKIAAPKPSAYINFTPDGDDLHISGGFGWSGDYAEDSEAERLAQPIAEHFINHAGELAGMDISMSEIDYCIRPSTPTGEPILKTREEGGKKQIFITGSGKSGTTHAPVLAEHVLSELSDINNSEGDNL